MFRNYYSIALIWALFIHPRGDQVKEIRCPKCNKLLLKADVVKGEIKCERCKGIVKINIQKDRA